MEIYSKDLQFLRSIESGTLGWFYDVAERDADHIVVARHEGLYVFEKSGKYLYNGNLHVCLPSSPE